MKDLEHSGHIDEDQFYSIALGVLIGGVAVLVGLLLGVIVGRLGLLELILGM